MLRNAMPFIVVLALSLSWVGAKHNRSEKLHAQYKLQSECTDGRCHRVKGFVAITSDKAYIRLDTTLYTFKVNYYNREERIAAIGGHGVKGILRQEGNTLQFFVTPDDKHKFKPTTVYYIYTHAATY